GDRLAGQVVLRRAEAAGRYDEVRTTERTVQDLAAPCRVVPDGGDKQTVNSEIGEARRQVLRVRIHDLAEEQLGPDGEDLGAHCLTSSLPGWHAACTRHHRQPEIPTLPFLTTRPRRKAGFCGSRGSGGLGYDAQVRDRRGGESWPTAIASSARPRARSRTRSRSR